MSLFCLQISYSLPFMFGIAIWKVFLVTVIPFTECTALSLLIRNTNFAFSHLHMNRAYFIAILYVCVCTYLCVCVCMHAALLEHGGVFLNPCSSYFLRQWTWISMIWWDCRASISQNTPVSTSPALLLQAHGAMQGLLHVCWGSGLRSACLYTVLY